MATSRVELRVSGEQKRLLEQAAAVRGQDLTSFALGVLLANAAEVVRQHQVRTLSRRDMRALAEALAHPPAPNAALKKAVQRLEAFRGR